MAKVGEVDPMLGRIIDGRYRVVRKLGEGGVGAVYEGEHIEIKKPVAIKVLHGVFSSTEEFRLRFEREARAASRLEHPSCVTVLDFGRVQRLEPMEGAVGLLGIPYLVMEFVRGQSLVDRLKEGPPLSTLEAVQVELGILAALKHAHSLGIIHRDVKPANVMIIPDEGKLRPKLLDFGLAKDLAAPDESLTQAGMVFGTPSYLSPEQAQGSKADARSDLYSAGVMLFEMVCGRRPFVHEDPLDTVRDHLEKAPPRPKSLAPGISDALEAVILRSLAKDPNARYPSADAFVAALAACLDKSPVPVPARPKRPLPVRQIAAVVAGVLMLGLAIRWWASRPSVVAPPPVAAAPAPPAPLAHDAESHLEQAGDYQRKLWCSDALEELERALKSDAAVRHDPRAARIAVSCLTPKTREKATRFLVEKIGPEVRPLLQEAAQNDENSEVRKGAERALSRLGGGE
jgi:serine/threonine protein kinase